MDPTTLPSGSSHGLGLAAHTAEWASTSNPGLGFPPHVDSHNGRISEAAPAPGLWEGIQGCDEGQNMMAPPATGGSRLVEPGTGCAHKEFWRRLRARKANPVLPLFVNVDVK